MSRADTEEQQLLRRAQDLSERCARQWTLTHTGFLTPAEQYLLQTGFHPEAGTRMILYGGYTESERRAAFFLPENLWEEMTEYGGTEDFGIEIVKSAKYGTDESGREGDSRMEETVPAEIRDCLRAVRFQAYFGTPGHRDYLGALMASGISRDHLGDILIEGAEAFVFCLPTICDHLMGIDRIGRVSVKTQEMPLFAVPVPKKERKTLTFSVMSLRADAVAAGMFRLSRTACARCIEEGALSLNYKTCLRTDAAVRDGDVLSLRGHGKGTVSVSDGRSRKGRVFLTAEIFMN